MMILTHMRILMITSLLWTVIAVAKEPLSEVDFSKTFHCPEALPSDSARADAVHNFLLWAQQSHPDLTIEEIVELRIRLLEEHHCEKTLSRINGDR